MKRIHFFLLLLLIFIAIAIVIFLTDSDKTSYIEKTEPETVPKIVKPPSTENALIEKTVQDFYQAIATKNCDVAIQLRRDYTVARCEKITDVEVQNLSSAQIDATHAIVYLVLQTKQKRKKKWRTFEGYLRVKKEGQVWKIMGDYQSKNDISQQAYIDVYKAELSLETNNAINTLKNVDVIDADHPELITNLRKKYPNFAAQEITLVDVSEQKLYLYDANNQLKGSYPISTALKGIGNQGGSDQTPVGAHRVSEKFGQGAEIGTIFKARNNTGKLAKILTEPVDVETDAVTTRVLWLDGLEVGKNKGGNVDSHSRYIYIHGTPEEGLIGKPASHGCVRMKNKDVVTLFNVLAIDSLVYIGQ